MLLGRLGRDPELRETQKGNHVCTFPLCTWERWADSKGPHERLEWHKIEVYSKLASWSRDVLKKGSLVYVEGILRSKSWRTHDGHRGFVQFVEVKQLQLLERDKEKGSFRPAINALPQRKASHNGDPKSG